MGRPTCETCVHWFRRKDADIDVGECVFNPPNYVSGTGYWPTTDNDDTCSKHQDFHDWMFYEMAKRRQRTTVASTEKQKKTFIQTGEIPKP
jgi:hypothetical protein